MEKPKLQILNIKTPIAVVGLGVSGEAALNLLLRAGLPRPQIATFDNKNAADYNDPKLLTTVFKPKTLVVSPGVPLSTPWIRACAENGVEITSELSLAVQILETEKVIGVTGSLGKSTLVSLLQAGLCSFSKVGFVGGNLGIPLSEYACKVLSGSPRADWVVLELSSYNLENCQGLACDIGAITYLTPNHMERYESLERYYNTKWDLVKMTTGPVILNRHGGDLPLFAQKFAPSKNLKLTDRHDIALKKLNLEDCQLLGLHNQDNLAMACQIAIAAKWPRTSITAMKLFRGLPHRVENLGAYNGIRFVNDSKATTMKSVLTAVESIRPSVSGAIHVLLGGKDKSLPWRELNALMGLEPIQFYFFGECRSVAHASSGLSGSEYPRLSEAIASAKGRAKAGDLILLSPGGTSLDEFKNFEARGDFFRSQAF